MTNQASEDDVRRQINKIFDETRIDYEGVYEPRAEELLIELIRTEKLNLLAEVRDRVVGESIPHDWGDDIDDMAKWKYYTGYKSNANDFVAGYNRSRAERLEQLTKLEANQ